MYNAFVFWQIASSEWSTEQPDETELNLENWYSQVLSVGKLNILLVQLESYSYSTTWETAQPRPEIRKVPVCSQFAVRDK